MANSYTEEERRQYEDLLPTCWGLLVALLLGLLIATLRFIPEWAAVFTSLLWACAWLASGFLFGFLFGIPKVVQRASDASKVDQSSYRLGVNTNLEEISDWLTKILVGATLTQLVKVPGRIAAAAEFVARGLGGAGSTQFAASLLLYFSAVGFFAGYVLTRMFFQRAFGRSDASTSIFSAALISTIERTSVAIGTQSQYPDEVQKAAEALRSVDISESLSGSAAAAVAVGAIVDGDASRAVQASSLAVVKNPSDPRSHLNYAVALHEAKADPATVMRELEQARELITPRLSPLVREDIINSIVYVSLYLPPPLGYTAAIEAAEKYIHSNHPGSGAIFLNLACAYGQKYKYLKQSEAQDADLKTVRDKALEAVRNAISLERSWVHRLRELMYLTGAPDDDDLKEFATDEDFKKLIDC
jgi:hypothetical protein